jgi:hypothetical protein
MRMLREAAVVAAMVGSVSMFGAGVAAAHGNDDDGSATINCDQSASTNTATTQIGGTTITIVDTGNGGNADASAKQQICGVDNEDNENTAGDATGGVGTGVAA